MATILGIDHKYFAVGGLALATGLAAFATYTLLESRKRNRHNVYESDKILSEYLLFHYGSKGENLKYDFGPENDLDFPKRCAEVCLKYGKDCSQVPSRALDIGCAVGRSSFELAVHYKEVIGIDYSQSFVDTCIYLKRTSQMFYSVVEEGDIKTRLLAKVPDHIDTDRVKFEQGDACKLRKDLGQFGCVLAANLICRLYQPLQFLDRLPGLVAPGGVLVITAPYTWLSQFCEKKNWLGGYYDGSGNPVTGFSALQKHLGQNFDLLDSSDMPFFIRETARKNQWTVANLTVWKRKSN